MALRRLGRSVTQALSEVPVSEHGWHSSIEGQWQAVRTAASPLPFYNFQVMNNAVGRPAPIRCLASTTVAYGGFSHSTGNMVTVEAARRPKKGWAAVPAVPKVLGLTGLIPFFALSPPVLSYVGQILKSSSSLEPFGAFILNDVLPSAALMQIGYGTAIVSFLGAVHWGAAMQSRTGHTTKIMFERYVWSVVPPLVVAPAASAGPETGGIIVLSALLLTFCIDAKFNWKGALPKWYMSLRVPLTLGAASAMALTLYLGTDGLGSVENSCTRMTSHDDLADAVVLR